MQAAAVCRLMKIKTGRGDVSGQAVLDDLFARYTMVRERDVHRDFLRGFGITAKMPARAPANVSVEEDDGVLLF